MTDKPKRQYFFSQEQKTKMAARKAIREKERELKKIAKKLDNTKQRLKHKKEALGAVDQAINPNEKSKTGSVVEKGKLDKLPKKVKELLEKEKDRIVFKPNDGPQTEFLAAGEQDVLYGGSAGGGKSYAMLVDPLRYMHIKEHRALLLRKSMPELRELIDKSRELYPKAFAGAKFREVEKYGGFRQELH